MKLSKTKFFIVYHIVTIILFLVFILYTWESKFPQDTINRGGDLKYGFFHGAIAFIGIFSFLTVVVLGIINIFSNGDSDLEFFKRFYIENDEVKNSDIKFSFKLKYLVWFVGILFLFLTGKSITSGSIKLYNNAKIQQNLYSQKTQEKQGFYDKLWLTYNQKNEIAIVNRETFILITKIIMENRSDGKTLSWKWVQENQNIPYEEFTQFYTDLSQFIQTQREAYFQIERSCQIIAAQNNMLLDTFPHNVYNTVLNLPKIEFKYSLLSDSTKRIFKSQKQ
jgi:hypothetical protein